MRTMQTWITRKLVDLVLEFSPVEYIIEERFSSCIYKYHIIKIIDNLEDRFKIANYCSLSKIYEAPSFKGLISNFFDPNNLHLSPKDVAVCVNISISGYCNEKDTYNDVIIDFSYSFLEKLKKRIIRDKRLNNLLSSIGKDITYLQLDYDRDEIETTLSSKKGIFSHYFKSFEDKNFSHQITIWHQADGKSWLEWKSEDSITLNLDPSSIREGFFLIGFDYSQGEESLAYATRIKEYEYFSGVSGSIKDADRVIWLR